MYFTRAEQKHSVTSWLPDILEQGGWWGWVGPCPCSVSKLPTARAIQKGWDLAKTNCNFPQTGSNPSASVMQLSKGSTEAAATVLFPGLLPSLCSVSGSAICAIQKCMQLLCAGRKQPNPKNFTAGQAHNRGDSPRQCWTVPWADTLTALLGERWERTLASNIYILPWFSKLLRGET